MSVSAATTFRQLGSIEKERFLGPGKIRQAGQLILPYFNSSTTLSILKGQPFVAYGRVVVAEDLIPPQKVGSVLSDWVCEFLIKPDLAGANILQDALVYWNTTLNFVQRLDGNVASGTVVTGIGAATNAQPGAGNGFLLGRAIADRDSMSTLNINGGNLVVAVAGTSKWITVASLPGTATVY